MTDPNGQVVERLLLTVAEAAELLEFDQARVYRLIRNGELGSVRIRSCRRVPVSAVKDYQRGPGRAARATGLGEEGPR